MTIKSEITILTDEEWIDTYEPYLDRMFETYGEDKALIDSIPMEYVWTMVDGDEATSITNGMAYVNRIAYYVSKKPHNLDDFIIVEEDAI